MGKGTLNSHLLRVDKQQVELPHSDVAIIPGYILFHILELIAKTNNEKPGTQRVVSWKQLRHDKSEQIVPRYSQTEFHPRLQVHALVRSDPRAAYRCPPRGKGLGNIEGSKALPEKLSSGWFALPFKMMQQSQDPDWASPPPRYDPLINEPSRPTTSNPPGHASSSPAQYSKAVAVDPTLMATWKGVFSRCFRTPPNTSGPGHDLAAYLWASMGQEGGTLRQKHKGPLSVTSVGLRMMLQN